MRNEGTPAVAKPRLKLAILIPGLVFLASCGDSNSRPQETTFSARDLADAVHAVASAHRDVYTSNVVNRLTQAGIVEAHEDFEQRRTLLLPAQLFRFSAEAANDRGVAVEYALKSLWPINDSNGPASELEKVAMQSVVNTPDINHYTEEIVADVRYFVATYADRASATVCVSCHNTHPQSAKTDFQLNDVMGAVVVRVAMN